MTTDNMRIWNRVCKTDPAHTKKVTFGRKFTAIDAQYQIQMATEVFGPIGANWSYACRYDTLSFIGDNGGTETLAMVDVTLAWSDDSGTHGFGPIRGCEPLRAWNDKQNKHLVDDDAFKKATTDALTKLLSHLGFNADVFLGLFDDNKYVARRQAEVAAETRAQTTTPKGPTDHDKMLAYVKDLLNRIAQLNSTKALQTLRKAEAAEARTLPKDQYELIVNAFQHRLSLISDPDSTPKE